MADTAARLAISARRNEVARFTIAVTGIDLTGVALAMQIRLGRDVPGAPLIALATVSTLAAEGLKLDSVTITNGVPTSIIKGRINQATMTDATKVPYMGEIGTDWVLAYAMQWTLNGDAQTRLYGDFVVLGSAFNSDDAPASRPQSYGSALSYSGGSSGGSLSFGDQVIQVSIAAIDQLAPLLANAAGSASGAKASAEAARGEAIEAAASRAAAELALGAAEGQAQDAGASADTAAHAEAGVLAAIAGNPIAAVVQLQAVSRNAFVAMTETTQGRQAHLSEAGQDGDFSLLPANPTAALAARIAADTDRGLYVTQANGRVWARAIVRRIYEAAWMLGSGSAFTDAQVPIQRMFDLMEPYSTLLLPRAQMTFSASPRALVQGLTVQGASGLGSFIVANEGNENYWQGHPLLYLSCNDVTVDEVRWRHRHHTAQAGGGFCIEASNHLMDPTKTDGFQQRNVTVRNSRFEDCAEGIVFYGNNRNGSGQTDLANYYPIVGVKAHHNEFLNMSYQSMSVFMVDDVDLHDFRVVMQEMSVARFTPNLRILGSQRVRVHDFDLRGTGLPGFGGNNQSWGIGVLAATSSGTRRMNSDVSISNFRISNSRVPLSIQECAGTLMMANGVVDNDLGSSEDTTLVLLDQPPQDNVRSGRGNNLDDFIMRDVRARGLANGIKIAGRCGSIDVDGLKLLGNARAAVDPTRAFATDGNPAYRYQAIRLANSEFLMPDGAGNVTVEINQGTGDAASAADYAEVVGNTFAVGNRPNGNIYKTGKGSIRTSKGGAAQMTGEGGAAPMGQNDLFPAGHFERMRSGA